MTVTLTPEQWVEVEKAFAQKHTPSSTTLTAPTTHGPFHGNAAQQGIFTSPGVRPERWQTVARPWNEFVSALPLMRSVHVKERLEVMSGVTAASGSNATGWCEDPPTVGQGKICEIDFEWGEYYVKTPLSALPLTGQRVDYADVPAMILNDGPANHPWLPSIMFNLVDGERHARYLIWLTGVEAERTADIVLFQGNSTLAAANTNTGFISEPEGLDRLIKTGYTDAKTSQLCPAVDSAVVSFNAAVNGTIGGGDGRNIVQASSDLYYGLRQRARRYRMNGTVWGIVLREELFQPLVAQWACDYATYRCASTNAGQPFVNDVTDTNRLRLEMENGMYLLHDGIRIPVFFSEGITQDVLGNQHFKSDMYYVPLNWRGVPLTYVQYFPMNNPEATELGAFSSIERTTMNDGFWLMASEDTALCTELHFANKWRLILETPFLAGRIDDISYNFRGPTRSAQPGDTFRYADGGRTYRN